jgi:tetratricopeptide (TPR) repeat protein
MGAGRKAVERQAWDEAAASFATAIDKIRLSDGLRGSSRGRIFVLEMVEQPEVYERLVVLRPRWFLSWCRGLFLANRRDWSHAAEHFSHALKMTVDYDQLTDEEKLREQILELGWKPTEDELAVMAERISRESSLSNSPRIMYYLALVRLLAGDDQGYQELCDRIVRDANRRDTPLAAGALSRTLSIGSATTTDTAAAIRLAENAAAAEPKVSWHGYSLGVAQYRAGQFEEAIRSLEKSLSVDPAWLGRCQTFSVLAMACQKLDRHKEARDWLAKAKPALVELEQTVGKQKYGFANSNYIGDWLASQILLAEAGTLEATEKHP